MMSRVIRYIMEDENFEGFIKQILGDHSINEFRLANNGCYFANYYYLKLKNISD